MESEEDEEKRGLSWNASTGGLGVMEFSRVVLTWSFSWHRGDREQLFSCAEDDPANAETFVLPG